MQWLKLAAIVQLRECAAREQWQSEAQTHEDRREARKQGKHQQFVVLPQHGAARLDQFQAA